MVVLLDANISSYPDSQVTTFVLQKQHQPQRSQNSSLNNMTPVGDLVLVRQDNAIIGPVNNSACNSCQSYRHLVTDAIAVNKLKQLAKTDDSLFQLSKLPTTVKVTAAITALTGNPFKTA